MQKLHNIEPLEYLKKLTLLCVEDDKTTQLFYKAVFEDFVRELLIAGSVEEAYSICSLNEIDIVIVDYSLPGSNGLELIQTIRTINEVIPIIFASAIEDINVVINALKYNISTFIKKPIERDDIFKAVENGAKILIANEVLQKEQEQAIYHKYQQDKGFAKELNILRNDFYYQMVEKENISLIDFLYNPLDILSGDAYCARRIDENNTFYLMVDGMGKGISASLTAMIMTSFVNHVIDKMIQLDSFDLAILVHETMEYIKPVLLDEEALAIDYILIDDENQQLYYAKFGMPVFLLENGNCEVISIRSNNSPLSKWQDTFNIDSYNIANIKKILIYSDGMIENTSKYDGKVYAEFIKEDFRNSFTREDLKNSFFEKITIQEDDITMIYINRTIPSDVNLIAQSFKSSLEDLELANEWYMEQWNQISDNEDLVSKASVVFAELMMNAHEHGNLEIDTRLKHQLLSDDTYIETLLEKERSCTKMIHVKMNKIHHAKYDYIVTQIIDEGKGFDTQILAQTFRNAKTFNGRGVFVSRKNSLGIYYNARGNSVLFLHKV